MSNKDYSEGPIDRSKCNHEVKAYDEFIKEWARMKKTHKQAQCNNCGNWCIWVKK